MLFQEACTNLLERFLVINPHELYRIRVARCHCNVKVSNKLNVNVLCYTTVQLICKRASCNQHSIHKNKEMLSTTCGNKKISNIQCSTIIPI